MLFQSPPVKKLRLDDITTTTTEVDTAPDKEQLLQILLQLKSVAKLDSSTGASCSVSQSQLDNLVNINTILLSMVCVQGPCYGADGYNRPPLHRFDNGNPTVSNFDADGERMIGVQVLY